MGPETRDTTETPARACGGPAIPQIRIDTRSFVARVACRSTRCGSCTGPGDPSYKRRSAAAATAVRAAASLSGFRLFSIYNRRGTITGGGSVPGPVLGAYCWASPPALRGCLIITRLLVPVRSLSALSLSLSLSFVSRR